jgi:hypothetical protein
MSVCVCVCVCACARAREREEGRLFLVGEKESNASSPLGSTTVTNSILMCTLLDL